MSNTNKRFIKGYELQDLIGEGAYGAVYRAYQPRNRLSPSMATRAT
jgi:hypothetical protein